MNWILAQRLQQTAHCSAAPGKKGAAEPTSTLKGTAMSKEVIQDWTDSTVLLKFGQHRDVRYQVYRDGQRLLQEIRDEADKPIHTLELPTGLVMERQSYEVLLRYVLLDVVTN
jgi:hypothetical protein